MEPQDNGRSRRSLPSEKKPLARVPQQEVEWKKACGEERKTSFPRRPVVTDDSITTVAHTLVLKELMCPICLNLIDTTFTVMECLHRFCRTCILEALRKVKKECPTCRVRLPSQRHLRPDPSFDGLINCLYPKAKRARFEALREETIRKQVNTQAMSWQYKRGPPQKNSHLHLHPYPQLQAVVPEEEKEEESRSTKAACRITGPVKEIRFIVRRHVHETRLPELSRGYLKTSRELTIAHLGKFLTQKLTLLVDPARLEITVAHEEQADTPLDPALTLGAVQRMFWANRFEELTLYYRLAM